MKLFTTSNPKTMKGEAKGYETYILHLQPSDLSGVVNVCAKATPGCRAACLNTAGRGGMFRPGETTNRVQDARRRRTVWFHEDREGFLEALREDIHRAVRRSQRRGFTAVIRLNGTSDIVWEKYGIIQEFPEIQFYDYTKIPRRRISQLANYHLTFSAADGNQQDVEQAVQQGMNVAVVFDRLPARYMGRDVIDGDQSDLRFLDPSEVIVGLKAKGRARHDTTGFVVRTQERQMSV